MAALTDLGATARPTCTTDRHNANDYHSGRCRCDKGRAAHRHQSKLRQRGLAPTRFVSSVGTRRRIEGLLALGWTGAHIAAAGGMARTKRPSQIGADRRCTRVTVETALAVRRAVAKLGGTPGPSANTRGQARRLGYVSLWAWNDDIDNPDAEPEGALWLAKPMPALTPSLVDRFRRHSAPVVGSSHIRWMGATDERGRGKLAFGPKDRRTTVSARRVAFVLHHRREPRGPVVPECGFGWCVAGPCMVDDQARAAGQRKAAA